MVKIEIDDKQIMDFFKSSPKRSKWAMSEALKKTGGHYRKDLKAYVESGLANMAPLHPVSLVGREGNPTPLYNLAKKISFKYGMSKGAQRVQIGWIGKGAVIVKRALYGRRHRVTEKTRKMFHYRGYHLRAQTKMLTTPARPALTEFWKNKERGVLLYVEKNFFEKFFSKGKPRIGF